MPHANLTAVSPAFFRKDAVRLARDLLGRVLVRRIGDAILAGKIVETEAYSGLADKASHAYGGLRTRNAPMFGAPGTIYVYLIYGTNYCFNIVCGKQGHPDAVLVRALEPLFGNAAMRAHRGVASDTQLTNGPGKLCQALRIDKTFNHASLIGNEALWLAKGTKVPDADVATGPRIGLGERAAEWRDKDLRFALRGNLFLSRKIP